MFFAKGYPFYSYSIVTPSDPACVVAYRLTKDLSKAKIWDEFVLKVEMGVSTFHLIFLFLLFYISLGGPQLYQTCKLDILKYPHKFSKQELKP